MNVRVTGAEQLVALARAAKAVDGTLRKELLSGLRNAAKKSIPEFQDSARETLPSSGGLADQVASSKFAARTRTTGSSGGVRVVATWGGHDIAATNAGMLRHPVFGSGTWVLQQIEPGWWDRAGERAAPGTQRELFEVMEETNRRIARSV